MAKPAATRSCTSSPAFAAPLAGLMAEVVEDHVRTHLVDAEQHPGALNADAAEQLLEVVRTYLK